MKTTYSIRGTNKLLYAAGLIFFCLAGNIKSYSQNVCIAASSTAPLGCAMLDVESTTSGFLAPRMTNAQRVAIASPTAGLLVYCTDPTAGFWYYTGAIWTQIGGNGWGLTGNAGTTASGAAYGSTATNNFIGTTDGNDFVFATNNYERMRIKSGGNIGIGTETPDASSLLQLSSGSQGILFPKVALTATNAAGPVSNPASTLFVYNTATAGSAPTNVNPGFYYNAGNGASPNWVPLLDNTPPNAGWMVTGNYGTSPASNWVGTNDANDLAFHTNGAEIMRVTSANANVGIGTNAPNASSELNVSSTTKGLLIPNVALTATNAAAPITLPATSLLVYNTASTSNPPYSVSPGYYYNSGTPAAPLWVKFASTGSASFQYENRFQTNGTNCGGNTYYYNSSNYGPGTYGDNTNPYRNDYASGYYLEGVNAPQSIPAFNGVWYVSYTATATTTFTGYNGWVMIEDNYSGIQNGSFTGSPTTVTIYFYYYHPLNGNTGTISGTLCGSGSAVISNTFVPLTISFTCASPQVMAPGDILIGYCTASDCPFVHSAQYYSLIDCMGAMQFN
jgi:hypothetical protein